MRHEPNVRSRLSRLPVVVLLYIHARTQKAMEFIMLYDNLCVFFASFRPPTFDKLPTMAFQSHDGTA